MIVRFLILRCGAYFDLTVKLCGAYLKKYGIPEVYALHIYDILSVF